MKSETQFLRKKHRVLRIFENLMIYIINLEINSTMQLTHICLAVFKVYPKNV